MSGHPETSSEVAVDAIRAQLYRLLASARFRNSKRCRPFLEYIVEQTLEGNADHLKERHIGIEVFGRDSAYVTGDDAIVRTTAVEVRKRLGLYYAEPEHESELRIELPAGAYLPQFRQPDSKLASERDVTASEQAKAEAKAEARKPNERRRRWFLASVAALPVAAGGAFLALRKPSDPVERFWDPFWRSADTVTIGIGEDPRKFPPNSALPTENSTDNLLGFGDVMALAQMAVFLRLHGRKYEIRRAHFLTLQDLTKAPAVMLGAFGNPWTLRVQEDLRFTMHTNLATGQIWMSDRQKPEAPLMNLTSAPYSQRADDYAIISRFVEARSQQPMLVLAGIGGGGTRAAGNFVTEPKHLEELAARAPANQESKNLQIVLKVDLVNGTIGSPKILATHFW